MGQQGRDGQVGSADRRGQGRAQRGPAAQNPGFGTFMDCVNRVWNSKVAGPGGVPDELLKHLPAPLLRAIHNMFVSMWVVSHTSAAWKRCHTVMLTQRTPPTTGRLGWRRHLQTVDQPADSHTIRLHPAVPIILRLTGGVHRGAGHQEAAAQTCKTCLRMRNMWGRTCLSCH